jgi:hypothetical protein
MGLEDYFDSCKCSVDFPAVAAEAGKPEAEPFDLLCHLAFPPAGLDEALARRRMLTGRHRADRVIHQTTAPKCYAL